MVTLNTIVKRWQDFAENHYFLRAFSFGAPEDVDLSKQGQYPLMHVIYQGAAYEEGTKTLDFEIYILDLPSHYDNKQERQKETVSDAEQCAEDILADIANGQNIFVDDENYEVTSASVTPLAEEGSNVLAGVLLEISIQIPYDRSACDAPINGVLPEGGGFVYQRRGLLRILTQNGATDVASVNTIRVTNGTLTDLGGGIVSLDTGGVETLDELTDVTIGEPLDREALVYDEATAQWISSGPAKLDFPVFNAQGTLIPEGRVVRFNGAVQGDRPSVVLATANIALDQKSIVGITIERIGTASPGHVRPFGTIYGLDTSAYTLGQILYISSTVAGALTATPPAAPNPRIPIAVVTRVHANQGRIFVRTWSPGYSLNDLRDVSLPGIPFTNEVLAWDGSKFTTRSLSTIPPVSGTPPPGGYKGVYWQSPAGDFSADQVFTYNSATYIVSALGISVTTINGRTIASDFSKLDGIQAGAEVNVNADWNASSGDAQILNKPALATVATSGAYADLSGRPSLAAVATSGAYADLSGRPTLAAVATSGLYSDLSGAPNPVTAVTGTPPIQSSGGLTPAISIQAASASNAGSMSAAHWSKLEGIAAGAEVNVNADWNAASGDAQILNKPTIPAQYSVVVSNATLSYGLVLADANEFMVCNSTSNFTITIPLNSSQAFAIGTEIAFMQRNTGTVTIQATAGVSLFSSQTARTAKQHAVIAIKKIDTDAWVCVGDRLAL